MKGKQEAAGGAYAAAVEGKEAARAALLEAEKGLVGLEADAEHCRAELEASQVPRRNSPMAKHCKPALRGGASAARGCWALAAAAARARPAASPFEPWTGGALPTCAPPLQAANSKLAEEVEALRRELHSTTVLAGDARWAAADGEPFEIASGARGARTSGASGGGRAVHGHRAYPAGVLPCARVPSAAAPTCAPPHPLAGRRSPGRWTGWWACSCALGCAIVNLRQLGGAAVQHPAGAAHPPGPGRWRRLTRRPQLPPCSAVLRRQLKGAHPDCFFAPGLPAAAPRLQ